MQAPNEATLNLQIYLFFGKIVVDASFPFHHNTKKMLERGKKYNFLSRNRKGLTPINWHSSGDLHNNFIVPIQFVVETLCVNSVLRGLKPKS